MRRRTFEVPQDVIGDVAQLLDDHELTNEIDGVTDDGDIIVSLDYESDEKKAVEEIHELIDKYNDNREDDDDEEDEEDEDED